MLNKNDMLFRIVFNKITNDIIFYYAIKQENKDTDYRAGDEVGYIDVPYMEFSEKLNKQKPVSVDPTTSEILFSPYTEQEYEEYLAPMVEEKRQIITDSINETNFFIEAHGEEQKLVELNVIDSARLTDEQYVDLLTYRYKLRNMLLFSNKLLYETELPTVPEWFDTISS